MVHEGLKKKKKKVPSISRKIVLAEGVQDTLIQEEIGNWKKKRGNEMKM